MKLQLFIPLFFAISASAAGSPPDWERNSYATESGRLQEALIKLDSILFGTNTQEAAVVPALFTQPPHSPDDATLKAIDDAARASIDALRMPEGLELQGGYTYSRSVGGTVLADIDEDWSYRNRLQMGVSWDLSQYKGFGNSLKRELIYNKATLDKMRTVAEFKRTALQETLNSTLEKYDPYLLSILNNRIYIYDVLLSLYDALYRTGDVAIDKLLDVGYKKKILEGVRESLSTTAPSAGLYDGDAFVFFRIDEERYRSLLSENEAVAINTLEWEMEKKREESFSYWNEIRVIPFARYQYLEYPSFRSDVSNGQVGINVVLPLFNRAKHDKLQSGRQQEILQRTLLQEEALVQSRGVDYIQSYRRTEQQLKSLLWDLQRYENEFRRWNYKYIVKGTPVNFVRAIELSDLYLESLYNFYLLRIEYERQLQNIKHLTADKDFGEFVALDHADRKSTVITKPLSAYVWSKQHGSSESRDDIVFLAGACRIGRLYIGYNRQLPADHYRSLIASIVREGISPYICISRTELLRETSEKINEYFQNFNDLPGLAGIHLDIEPHQLPDWKEQTGKYLDDLLSFLSIAKAYTGKNGLDLTIALPANYPRSFYEKVAPCVSGITLMIYNRSDLQDVITTLQGVVTPPVSGVQIEIAVRPEDYIPDYIPAISRLQENGAVGSVALESLETLDEVIQRNPAVYREGDTFTLSFFEQNKNKRTVVRDFKSYKEAVRYFGNIVKEK